MNSMQLPPNDNQSFCPRARADERTRLIVFGLLLVVLIVFEFTMGKALEDKRVTAIKETYSHWAPADYNSPDDRIPIPAKKLGKQRIVFISNSHAQTGGKVANHLQTILDTLAPDDFDVLDLSAAGIFAPDMLQRTLRSLDYEPDLIILNIAYISLSDRMPLSRQAHSARSFLKDGVASRLSAGFWLRNYDLGLYSDTLVSQQSRLFRYRNGVRDMWERPLANALRSFDERREILFLEVDENQSWKFPDGYDRHLFQWRLYASERDSHLQDLRELVTACQQAGVPLIATNLPIHFNKSLYEHDADDYGNYRQSLRKVFSDVLEYVDYEDFFPKEFTTYDALHPTWHGARLHAFDLTRRLAKHGLVPHIEDPDQLKAFQASDSAISNDLRRQLNGVYPPLEHFEFRRFDLNDPLNARKLLRQLAGLPVGSSQEQKFLAQLSLRLRFWLENDFTVKLPEDEYFVNSWQQAVQSEILNSSERLQFFRARLAEFQNKRLVDKPLPVLVGRTPVYQEVREIRSELNVLIQHFQTDDGASAIRVSSSEGQPFAYIVSYPDGSGYQRIDILRDGSFLELHPLTAELKLPIWMRLQKSYVKWGI